jgi:hypothetical protein
MLDFTVTLRNATTSRDRDSINYWDLMRHLGFRQRSSAELFLSLSALCGCRLNAGDQPKVPCITIGLCFLGGNIPHFGAHCKKWGGVSC